MEWYKKVMNQYADFNGRARRKEYWMFALYNFIFAIVAAIVDNILGISFPLLGYGPLYIIYALGTLVPGFAVGVRRLHDIGKSGWMLLIILIPLIGAIWILVLLATEGSPEENQYGLNPKNEDLNTIESL